MDIPEAGPSRQRDLSPIDYGTRPGVVVSQSDISTNEVPAEVKLFHDDTLSLQEALIPAAALAAAARLSTPGKDEMEIEPSDLPRASGQGDESEQYIHDLGTPEPVTLEGPEAVCDYLTEHARHHGYGISRQSRSLSKKGVVRSMTLRCGKSGKHQNSHPYLAESRTRPLRTKKQNCPFHIYAHRIDSNSNQWTFIVKNGTHNHPADDASAYTTNRKVSPHLLQLIHDLDDSGKKVNEIYEEILRLDPTCLVNKTQVRNIQYSRKRARRHEATQAIFDIHAIQQQADAAQAEESAAAAAAAAAGEEEEANLKSPMMVIAPELEQLSGGGGSEDVSTQLVEPPHTLDSKQLPVD